MRRQLDLGLRSFCGLCDGGVEMHLFIILVSTYVATVAFSILINIPRQALNLAGIVGTLGFLVYWLYLNFVGGYVIANLLGAVVIGIASMQAARFKKMPMILFNIPSIVPLVPGGQAYQMVKNFAFGNSQLGIKFMFEVIMIAGAIAFGFILAESFNKLRLRIPTRNAKRWWKENRKNPRL